MKWLWVVLFMGCSFIPPSEEPERLIWRVYEGEHTPPTVQWSEDCVPFDAPHCHEGVFIPERNLVLVVWRGTFSSSALAHEMFHAKHWEDFHLVDPLHERPDWILVRVANEYLKERGF